MPQPTQQDKRRSVGEASAHSANSRKSYDEHTLQQIRALRKSLEAASKGHPKRSSRLEVTPSKNGPPILSLTKLDFELLREWDWKERQKRLESWTGSKKRYRRGERAASKSEANTGAVSLHETVTARSERIAQAHAKGRTGLILKKELEHLTKMRVHPPSGEGVEAQRKPSGNTRFRGSYAARHQEQIRKVDKELGKVIDQVRADELKSTFGKGWGRQQGMTPNKKHHRKSSEEADGLYPDGDGVHRHRHHKRKIRPQYHDYRTDIEEEQPPTSKGQTTTTENDSSSPSGSAASIGLPSLFKSIHELENEDELLEEEVSSDDSGEEAAQERKLLRKYRQPVEYQDTCFGGIKFVERQALQPETKDKRGHEFYMTFADTDLGLGLGKTQHLRIRFFKPDGPGTGRSERILARGEQEKSKKDKDEEQQKALMNAKPRTTIKSFSEIPDVLELSDADKTKYADRLADLQKALMQIPGIGSQFRMSIDKVSRRPSENVHTNRVSRRQQFTRPPRRIWYTPLPQAIKRYYRTNWRRIKFDIREKMRSKGFWPKMWINFEKTHPKQLFELLHYKLAIKQFDEVGYKRIFNWGKGVHPDYFDWMLEDIVPHPGRYYYDDDQEDPIDPLRKASLEEKDFDLKQTWFMKPPRYIPPSPLSPPFDQYDFCGYGNREESYFLDFTLPRQLRHYYQPATKIEKFFTEIPKPPYAFPGYTFKRWLKYPLDKKLPAFYPFPKRFSFWTRGRLGDALNCNSQTFHLDDPLLLKRDLAYNVYHDVHARKYILHKPILDRIYELGIVNDKGEVNCTMKEFNQHRRYLRDYEWLEECLRRWSEKWISRLEHNQITKDTNIAILDWEGRKREFLKKIERIKSNRIIQEELEAKRRVSMQQKYEKQLSRALDKREEVSLEMLVRAKRRKREQKQRTRHVRNLELGRQIFLQRIYAVRHKRAARHRARYYTQAILDKMERQKNNWLRHVAFNRRKLEEIKEIQEKLEWERSERIELRKYRIQKVWDAIPITIARKQERVRQQAQRVTFLASKYFHIWLRKTREIKALKETPYSRSNWPQNHLETYVAELKKLSGHVKVADRLYAAIMGSIKSVAVRQEAEHERKKRGTIHYGVEHEITKYVHLLEEADDTGHGHQYNMYMHLADSDSSDDSMEFEEPESNRTVQFKSGESDDKAYDADIDEAKEEPHKEKEFMTMKEPETTSPAKDKEKEKHEEPSTRTEAVNASVTSETALSPEQLSEISGEETVPKAPPPTAEEETEPEESPPKPTKTKIKRRRSSSSTHSSKN